MQRRNAAIIGRLLAWDRRPLAAFGLRAAIVLLAFRPWSFRFERVAFPATDLDPMILQAAKAAGIDIASPAGWPSLAGTLARILGVALAFALAWWVQSRFRARLMKRFGLGVWTFLGLGAGCLLVLAVGAELLGRLIPAPAMGLNQALPVWGGWLEHPLLKYGGFRFTLRALALLGPMGLELFILFTEGRLLLDEAQDLAMRARLSPHFFFNALNTLGAQIEGDPVGAQETTQKLAGLFAHVLQVVKRPTLALREELAMVELYLGLEKKRLGDRLQVSIEVPEEALDREIPVMALQLLVENAVNHAIAPRLEGGSLRIRAWEEGRSLWISVWDSGDGISRGKRGSGQALDNLRARLRKPGDLRFAPAEGGFEARLGWR